MMIVQWLYAEPVSRGKQPLPSSVPNEKCEHSYKVVQTFFIPTFVSLENDFRVRPAAVWAIPELGSQLEVIVDFAIENDPLRAVGNLT